MFALVKKEVRTFFTTPIGYIPPILFAISIQFLFVKDIFIIGSGSLKPFFAYVPWLFLICIPALSMRSLSEERKMNTLEVLLTLPLSESIIIISKLISLSFFICIMMGLTTLLPILLSLITPLYGIEIIIGYIGTILLGSAIASIGLFFSGKTSNQIIAFLSTTLFIFALFVGSTEFASSMLPPNIVSTLTFFSPITHYQNFVKGVIEFRSIFYFISIITLFTFLSIIDLERRA